jgi:NADPH:quinone reductase-like Zn-dependent oxidoreductase
MTSFKPLHLMSDNKGVIGVNLGHLWSQKEELAQTMAEILELVAERSLVPVVDRSFPLAEAAAAHRYIQDRRNFGKVVLVP